MKRFYIDYEDKSGDLSHVWVMANTAKEAEEKVKEEYWDISRIIQVTLGR